MILFDASTLILLAKAELLETLLNHVRQPVVIPQEVAKECCGAKRSLDALMIQKAIDNGQIGVLSVRSRKLSAEIRSDFPLGKGEAEVLTLAAEARERAIVIAIDDRHGINACKLLQVPFATAISILIAMVENGWVEQREALRKLDALERYGRYKAAIVAEARSQLEARK